MKRRGLASPDLGDCLAMTFAVVVRPRDDVGNWYDPLLRYRYKMPSEYTWMR